MQEPREALEARLALLPQEEEGLLERREREPMRVRLVQRVQRGFFVGTEEEEEEALQEPLEAREGQVAFMEQAGQEEQRVPPWVVRVVLERLALFL